MFSYFLHRKTIQTGGTEFKQDLMKSQTLPRSNGAQAKRALFERMNTEPTKYFSRFCPNLEPRRPNNEPPSELCFSQTDQRTPGPNLSAPRASACPVPAASSRSCWSGVAQKPLVIRSVSHLSLKNIPSHVLLSVHSLKARSSIYRYKVRSVKCLLYTFEYQPY